MAKQVVKSGLASRLGDAGRKAVEAHKNDEVRLPGGGELPAGIENGIAQLVECKFDVYKDGANKGKDYLYMAGICKLPTELEGLPIEGLRTSFMEPVCQTKKGDGTIVTIEDHIDNVLNAFRKLGVDTSGMGLEDLEPTAAALKEAKPTFRFRTWKGEKQTTGPWAGREPRVQHVWGQACEYQADETDDVVDTTEEAPQEETIEDPVVETQEGELDLASLAEAADGGDEEAMVTIKEQAEALGIDPDKIASWADVVEAINNAGEGETEETTEEEPEADVYTPEKGDSVFYKAPGMKKGVECEVTAVFEGKQLVNLKSTAGKMYKGISWDSLKDEP